MLELERRLPAELPDCLAAALTLRTRQPDERTHSCSCRRVSLSILQDFLNRINVQLYFSL
jgi:hypothetical protein